MSSESVTKWKIVAGSITALGIAFLGGGATERFVVRQPMPEIQVVTPGLTLDQLRFELEPIKNRLNNLETRTALNEAELGTYRARFLPKLDELAGKLASVAESTERIRGLLEARRQ